MNLDIKKLSSWRIRPRFTPLTMFGAQIFDRKYPKSLSSTQILLRGKDNPVRSCVVVQGVVNGHVSVKKIKGPIYMIPSMKTSKSMRPKTNAQNILMVLIMWRGFS